MPDNPIRRVICDCGAYVSWVSPTKDRIFCSFCSEEHSE